MTRHWEPGTQYNYGDVVEYQGQHYKIIQPHRSQGDWTPNVTPALWGVTDSGDDHCHQQQHQSQPNYGQAQQPYQQQQPYHDEKRHDSYSGDHQNQPTKEEKEKHWYDIDDKRKKQLEVGGGLLAGAALLGAGYKAFKEHEKHGEEKKAQVWALNNWITEAEQRTERYKREGPSGPATWILNKGKSIPSNAICVGPEKHWNLYICRAYYEGGLQIGKASDAFKDGAVIGYDDDEISLETYEILVGDMRGLRWVDASGRLNVNSLGYRPVEGGREADGKPLYIAKAPHKDAEHPGKAGEHLDGALIPYGGKEKKIEVYRVLCYA
ncbi:carbohydrate-binding module family 12 protein [Schizophyllum commune H4-8]|uniref:carbohydrate-binding module family 12 protein n=1 Tax=Schizophyllum commune (strain H4-8 / FGSC 9210) TaxID=578458 RepID=UPI00216032B4|nr:carbohydrate-binding module family 12 protein [Schizophyllum commune H4-8]KAI5889742.1 carbohydrate-binding module family 12 protein [Schizophyllum commune H4-8]